MIPQHCHVQKAQNLKCLTEQNHIQSTERKVLKAFTILSQFSLKQLGKKKVPVSTKVLLLNRTVAIFFLPDNCYN